MEQNGFYSGAHAAHPSFVAVRPPQCGAGAFAFNIIQKRRHTSKRGGFYIFFTDLQYSRAQKSPARNARDGAAAFLIENGGAHSARAAVQRVPSNAPSTACTMPPCLCPGAFSRTGTYSGVPGEQRVVHRLFQQHLDRTSLHSGDDSSAHSVRLGLQPVAAARFFCFVYLVRHIVSGRAGPAGKN